MSIRFGKNARGDISLAYIMRSKKFNPGIAYAKEAYRITKQDSIDAGNLFWMLENAVKAAKVDSIWLDFLILLINETSHAQAAASRAARSN